MFQEEITKEELDELPLKQFEGDVIVVDQPDQVGKAVNYLTHHRIIGFDTETRPSFKKGEVYRVSLLQLGSTERVYLFRLNKIGFPPELRQLLANPAHTKVGVAIRDDIKTLQRLKKFTPKGFIELQNMVKEYGINNFSLKKLSGIVLGFRISKSQRLSNWEADELSEAQQVYAATDAWAAHEIYCTLVNGGQ